MKTNLEPLCIGESATLRDAMIAINEGVSEIALVTNGDQKLKGVLTDGDVRRALLRGVGIDSPVAEVMVRDYSWVDEHEGRAAVLDLMRAKGISQVPALDNQGELVGLHLLHDFLARDDRANWAVVMAGGRGTRLHPLTEHTPKPMLPVAGRPILERIVLHLVGSGIKHVFISVNHLRDKIEDHFGQGDDFDCTISYLREDEPLGTGGPLSLLPERPKHPVLVMNGDLIVQLNVGAMLDFHAANDFSATMAVKEHSMDLPYAVADVEGDHVVQLQENPRLVQLVNAGIYILSPDALDLVPANTSFPITGLFEACMTEGLAVGAFRIQEDWTDIGRPEELARARGDR